MLNRWTRTPHVARRWDIDQPYTLNDLTEPRVTRRIDIHAGRPFADMQDYTVRGWPAHHFGHLP